MAKRWSVRLHCVGILMCLREILPDGQGAGHRVCLLGPSASSPRTSLFVNDSSGTVRAQLFGSGLFTYGVFTKKTTSCDLALQTRFRVGKKSELNEGLASSFSGPTVSIFSDEWCWRPPSVLRHIDLIQYYDEKDTKPHLPLGPHFSFTYVQSGEVLPKAKRPFWFNLVTSLSTNPERKDILAAGLKWRELKRKYSTCGFIHVTKRWSDARSYSDKHDSSQLRYTCPHAGAADDGLAEGHLHPEMYREVLLKSVFTLSPVGHNAESFRIYEAAEAGSIPVVPWGATRGCTKSLKFLRNSNAPFVFAGSLDDAHSQMSKLSLNPAALSMQSQQVRQWYESFMRNTMQMVEGVFNAKMATTPSVKHKQR